MKGYTKITNKKAIEYLKTMWDMLEIGLIKSINIDLRGKIPKYRLTRSFNVERYISLRRNS